MKAGIISTPLVNIKFVKADGSSFFRFCLTLLLIFGVMLPSDGDHGFLSPKSLAFLSCALSWCFYLFFNPSLSKKNQNLLIFFLISLMFLTVWMVLGEGNEERLAFAQFKVFLITLFTSTVSVFAVHSQVFSYERLFKTVLIANFTYSAIKVFVVLCHILKLFDIFQILDFLGFRFMSMGIVGPFMRMQTSVDIITPFLLFFVLSARSWNLPISSWFRSIYIWISWLSIFLSFSRFLIFCGVIAHLAFWITENRKNLALSVLKCLIALSCITVVIGPASIYKVVEKRFFSTDAYKSDEVREHQITEMMTVFEETPFLGQGLGGFAEKAIRDGTLKYSYEVQWISFLMQFGLVGLSILVLPIILFTYKAFSQPYSRAKFSLFMMFALWIFSGFTNPFLISLTSGILYALFYVSVSTYNSSLK